MFTKGSHDTFIIIYITLTKYIVNSAFFAEMKIHDLSYNLLIDTGSEVTWVFCDPPFPSGASKLAVSLFVTFMS